MIEFSLWSWLPGLAVAYGCGSIPFAWIIATSQGVNLREFGSGNIGASNCGRACGRAWGLTCFALDVLKGFAPVFLMGLLYGWIGNTGTWQVYEIWAWLAVALAAVMGHMFPVWLGFRGGKGVATGFGVLLGIYPWLSWPALLALGLWLVTARLTRYISVASIVAGLSVPVFTAGLIAWQGASFGQLWPFVVVTGLMAGVIVLSHRSNLRRLARGEESQLRWGKS